MALSLDLIIITNYKTMAPFGFEPGSASIVYVLPDPVYVYANFYVSICMFDFLFIFEFIICFMKTKIILYRVENSKGFLVYIDYFSFLENFDSKISSGLLFLSDSLFLQKPRPGRGVVFKKICWLIKSSPLLYFSTHN